jgi:acyl carrier protein
VPERKVIKDKLQEILEEISLNNDFSDNPDLNLKDDLGLDSLGLIQLVMEMNQAFNIEIKSTEIILENFETIGALEAFIFNKLIRN